MNLSQKVLLIRVRLLEIDEEEEESRKSRVEEMTRAIRRIKRDAHFPGGSCKPRVDRNFALNSVSLTDHVAIVQ